MPGASTSGFTRPSFVGPLDENSARLSYAFASGGASEKDTVSLPPACTKKTNNENMDILSRAFFKIVLFRVPL